MNINKINFSNDRYQQVYDFITTVGKSGEGFSKTKYYKWYARYIMDDKWSIKGGYIFYDGKVVVPPSKVEEWLENAYKNPLFIRGSPEKFHGRISQAILGISRSAVTKFMESKRGYQLHRRYPIKKIVQAVRTKKPREMFCIDNIDMKNSAGANHGYCYIFTCVDHFSKYAWAIPIRTRDTHNLIFALQTILNTGNIPHTIRSDNEFKNNKEIAALLKEYEIKLLASPPYAPQANGASERFNQTLKHDISRLQSRYDDATFLDFLPQVLTAYNNTPHSATKMSPASIFLSWDEEVWKKAYENSEKYRDRFISKLETKEDVLQVGQKVRVSIDTFANDRKDRLFKRRGYLPQYSDLYTIKEVLRSSNPSKFPTLYVLDDFLSERRFNRSQLRPVPMKSTDDVEERPTDFDRNFRGVTRAFRNKRTTKERSKPYSREPTRRVTRSMTKRAKSKNV